MIRAWEVRDRFGTQFHWEWFEKTPWTRRVDLLASMRKAKIDHLRTGCWPDDPAKSVATRDHPELHPWLGTMASQGVRFLFGFGGPWPGMLNNTVPYSTWFGPMDAAIDTIARRYPTACVGIEAPNEYDNPSPTSPNVIQPWTDNLREWIRRAGAALRANAKTAQLPFVGPSMVHDTSAAQLGDLTKYGCNAKNAHPYSGNRVYQQAWAATQKTRLDPLHGATAPIWATEFGVVAGAQSRGWPQANERQAAVLIVKQHLSLVLAGFVRSYLYALLDEQEGFGLLRNDLSERNSYRAVAKMNAVAGDKPSGTAPPELNWKIVGAPADCKKLVTWKANGKYVVWLWRKHL